MRISDTNIRDDSEAFRLLECFVPNQDNSPRRLLRLQSVCISIHPFATIRRTSLSDSAKRHANETCTVKHQLQHKHMHAIPFSRCTKEDSNTKQTYLRSSEDHERNEVVNVAIDKIFLHAIQLHGRFSQRVPHNPAHLSSPETHPSTSALPTSGNRDPRKQTKIIMQRKI